MKGHSLPGPNQRQSPAKQRDLGGTESGKGNVFTKRGRTQKKINAERAETDKLTKEHIAENERSTYLATKDHEAKMIKKQLKNRPKTVVMKGGKDVTDEYRSPEVSAKIDETPTKKKSPAKCPLVAALAPIAMQMMSKKKE